MPRTAKKNQPSLVSMTPKELAAMVGEDTPVRVSAVSLREIATEAAKGRVERKLAEKVKGL